MFARSTTKMIILRNTILSLMSGEVKRTQRSWYATASNFQSVKPSLKLSGCSENPRNRSGTSGWMQFAHKSIDNLIPNKTPRDVEVLTSVF